MVLFQKEKTGMTFGCKMLPESSRTDIYWYFDPNDFPEPQHTKITWDPWDQANNRPHVGVGKNPKLKVTYENPQSKYNDYMPPDNRWFGEKRITIQIGNETVTRPVWFFYDADAIRTIRQGGKKERAWYNYFKESGAVPLLNSLNFEFDGSLPLDIAGEYRPWSDTFVLGPAAASSAMKPVFDVNVANSYREEEYPAYGGAGVHGVAKTCWHEYWHRVLKKETKKNRRPWYGQGLPDDDRDGLRNTREEELGTKINKKDTCGISGYHPWYSEYASYADQELYCRWKVIGVLGDNSKDWSFFRFERERLANQQTP
jgi:hypothetical protein